MLVGIVVNNGILFVDFTNQLREGGMHADEALIETGKSRLRPILMTTLTTILSMVPMGIGFGKNGKMMQGMAMVIIGGLIASTILTLVLLPTFYMIIHKKSYKKVFGYVGDKNKKEAKRAKKELNKKELKKKTKKQDLEWISIDDSDEEKDKTEKTEKADK